MNSEPEDDDDDSPPDFDNTDFPPPHSAVGVLNELAAKHGLIKEGEYISQQMRDFLADVVEQCANAADEAWGNSTPGQRVRVFMAPESLEEARQLELKYQAECEALEERRASRRQSGGV